jgi:hypothetical protein
MLNLFTLVSVFIVTTPLCYSNIFSNILKEDSTNIGIKQYKIGVSSIGVDVVLEDGYMVDTIENQITYNYEFTIFKCITFDSTLKIKSSYNIKNKILKLRISDDLMKMCFEIDSLGNIKRDFVETNVGLATLALNYEYCSDSSIKVEYIQDCCSSKLKRKCQSTDSLSLNMDEFVNDPSFGYLYTIKNINPIINNPKKVKLAFYFRKSGELYIVEEQVLDK